VGIFDPKEILNGVDVVTVSRRMSARGRKLAEFNAELVAMLQKFDLVKN